MSSRMQLSARWLFDGETLRDFGDEYLVIEDGQITAIVTRTDTNDDVVDFGDATLMPGLIDIHQHLAFDASADPVATLRAEDDDALLVRMRANALSALAAGITTIRDLGDRNYISLVLRDEFARGDEVGPRLLTSGPPITVTNGHCFFLGGEADGVDGVVQAVRDRVAHGVDVIKIMATGGNMTPTLGPHESQYGEDEIRAAADEAHAHGLKLAVHAHGTQGVIDALAAGADSIEHCTFFNADGVDTDPELMARIAASDVIVSATGATLPPKGPPIYPAMAIRFDAILANHMTMQAKGARMVMSSDAGVSPGKPHNVLPHGVAVMVERVGMSPENALAAVTSLAATACGIENVTGTLEPGKAADILVVDGNVVGDRDAIHRVRAVYARGRAAPLTT